MARPPFPEYRRQLTPPTNEPPAYVPVAPDPEEAELYEAIHTHAEAVRQRRAAERAQSGRNQGNE